MELTLTQRQPGKKSEIKKIRREGNIPTVLYSKGEVGQNLIVDGNEFKKVLNKIEPGTLSSTIFTLNIGGQSTKALIKDIQYAITTYDPIHIDFTQLHEQIPIVFNVPVKLVGVAVCAGVKLGGVLRQVIRYVKVSCLPKDMPTHFDLDVTDLLLGQSQKLNQLSIPTNVRPITDLNEVAAVVSRR